MRTHILRSLSEKPFRNLWIGEIFTQIAVNIFIFFLILIVYDKTHSNTAVSIVVISLIVPQILFGSVAGVYVDHWNKKDVLIISNLLRSALLVLLTFFLKSIIMIYIFSFLIAVTTQFFIPEETPIIPLVVNKKHLLSANALFGLGIFGSIMVAYVLSGPILLFLRPVATLLLLAALLLAGALFVSFVKLHHMKTKPKLTVLTIGELWTDIHHTVQIARKSREIFQSLLLLALSQILILLVATVSPGYASQILNIQIEDFPLLFVTPAAIGMIVGAVLLVNYFHSHSKTRVINTGIILSGIAMLFLPYGSKVASRGFIMVLNTFLPSFLRITILHIMVVLAFILGGANALVFVPANTILQEKTTDEFRGKIYGLLNTVAGSLSLLPIILVGGLSDLVGVGAVLIGIGISLLFIGILRIFINL